MEWVLEDASKVSWPQSQHILWFYQFQNSEIATFGDNFSSIEMKIYFSYIDLALKEKEKI